MRVSMMMAFLSLLFSYEQLSLADEPVEAKADKRLFGSWQFVEFVDDGKDYLDVDPSDVIANFDKTTILNVVVVIDKAKIKTVLHGETQGELEYIVDCTGSPCTLDTSDEKKGTRTKSLWIYKFADDKLVLAGASEKHGRPKTFESNAKSGITRFVLKRIRPSPKK